MFCAAKRTNMLLKRSSSHTNNVLHQEKFQHHTTSLHSPIYATIASFEMDILYNLLKLTFKGTVAAHTSFQKEILDPLPNIFVIPFVNQPSLFESPPLTSQNHATNKIPPPPSKVFSHQGTIHCVGSPYLSLRTLHQSDSFSVKNLPLHFP